MGAKRKYARMSDKIVAYACTNKKCKWQGTGEQKEVVPTDDVWSERVCPKCGNNEFYGLLELPDS